MKKRYIALIIIIFIVFLGAVYLLLNNKQTMEIGNENIIDAKNGQIYQLNFERQGVIFSQGNSYTAEAYYPITQSDEVNTQIQEELTSRVNSFIVEEQALSLVASENNRNYLKINYIVKNYSSDIKSYIFTLNSYSGGSYSDTDIISMIFNLETGKQYVFEDIITDKDALEVALAENIKLQLEERREEIDEGMIAGGIDDYVFSLESGAINFYFAPLTVAPYADGMLIVSFELSNLEDILTDDFK